MIPVQWSSMPDWMRLVAGAVNPILSGYPYPRLASAPTTVTAGYTYYDTTLNKVRTWDGTAFNNHW